MKYPIEEIAYKMKFIMDKLNTGEELTKEEAMYAKKIMHFKSVFDSICLEHQMKEANIEHSRILKYLVKKRVELLKVIKGTKSKNKLEQLNAKVENIENFIRSEAVVYFKDFLIDHNEIVHVDMRQVFDNLAIKDDFLRNTMLDKDYMPYQVSPFIYENKYTGEVRLNRPLIDLVRIILAGDYKIYNAIEKRDRLVKSKGDNLTDREDLESAIPEEYRGINHNAISRIIYLGRGRIGNKTDHTFDDLRDDLDILAAMDQAQKGEMEQSNDQVINDSVIKILEGVISGTYKTEDFMNYQILKYFDKNTDTTKFREILYKKHFNLDAIQKELLQDDLLSKTSLNGSDNLFVDRDGELCLENISLAASIMNGEEINEDECLSANPKCLGRIKYYQPAHRPNPHEFERDKYDVKILQAIARYKQDLKLKLEQEKVDKDNKALL